MSLSRFILLGGAFLACAAFSSDGAGRACARAKGERGVAYDIGRTKVTDAYSPNGRRLIQDGHRLFNIEVPPLVKRDKKIECVMRLDDGFWRDPLMAPPGARDPLNPLEPRANPFSTPDPRDPVNPRETRERSFR